MLVLLCAEVGLTFTVTYGVLIQGATLASHASVAALVIALMVAVSSVTLGLYRPQLFMQTRTLLFNTALGSLLVLAAVALIFWAAGVHVPGLESEGAFWPTKIVVAWLAAVLTLRLCFLAALRSKLFVSRVAVLGAPGDMGATIAAIRGRDGFLEAVLPAADGVNALRATSIRRAVGSAGFMQSMGPGEHLAFTQGGVMLETEAEFWERQLRRVAVHQLTADWFAEMDALRPGAMVAWMQAGVTRGLDIACSASLLLLTLPLMLLTALAIRLEGLGPILYRQERAGLGHVPFTLLKFRSMRVDSEPSGPAWTQRSDPRITRVGQVIRRTRIDELPQLLNVLRGEMSLVGPRPERPHFVDQLARSIPFYHERARVKPGLTGWAQINYPYGASVEDARAKLSYDLYYIRYRSPLMMLGILFGTVRVILFQEGAR